jgi:hypothetical protein
MLTTRRNTRLTAVALASALVFSLAACGDDSAGLAAPVPIRVSQVAAEGSLAAGVPESDSMSTDRAMWWFGGFEYQIGEGLNALPTDSTGYRFGPADGAASVSEDEVRRLATALGITEALVKNPNPEFYDQVWTAGPNDGSAPSLTVVNDPQITWYYSGAWAMAGSGDTGVSSSEGGTVEPRDPDAPDAPDEIREWEPPTPPEGILTAEQAQAEATRIITALGLNVADFELEVWADEWYASVTAWPQLGGRRSPMTWNFGFGEMGALQWAGGFFASAVATGPFPLIGLDEALVRLDDQYTGWGSAIGMPAPEMARTTDSEDEQMPEPEKEIAVLVKVEADLWWATDVDGAVWLLPAYRFTDTEGREHTVAAVTDEFLMIEPQVAVAEPLPAPAIDVAGPGSDEEAAIMEELFNWASKELVGMDLDAAIELAATKDAELRVARRDGEDLALTMDYRFNRINVATTTADGSGTGPETIVEVMFPG